ncbi:MAG: hypothetical protein Q4A11_00105 [Brachymonas sp.]|nr:hypothetical protein [Brachymonas sp.]
MNFHEFYRLPAKASGRARERSLILNKKRLSGSPLQRPIGLAQGRRADYQNTRGWWGLTACVYEKAALCLQTDCSKKDATFLLLEQCLPFKCN